MSQKIFIEYHNTLLCKKLYTLEIKNSNNIIVDYYHIKINYKFDIDKIELLPEMDNFDSTHIFRLLSLKNFFHTSNHIKLDEEIITEYLLSLNNILSLGYKNYCTICGCELNAKGLDKLSHCNNFNCINEYYSIPTDNRVLDLYNQDPRVFMFLLNIFVSGLSHPKVSQTFKPLPYISNISNVSELINIIPDELQIQNHNKIMNKLNNASNDLDLYSKLNKYSYSVIKNAISNNYFSMSSRENIFSDNSTIFIHINYSAEIENKFQQNHYLFHGSSIHSWYPIIKNGLKVMSGTALQANGSAYGKGIYFSDSFELSLGYSTKYNSLDIRVVGVFEISEDPSKYKKTTGIFVVPDDKILLLRTLIILKPTSKNLKNITEYFIKELPLQKKMNKISIGIVKNKRLDSEYKKLSTIEFINNIVIIDQTKWIIEFIKIKNKIIQIEIIFSSYPISPPIIKITSNLQIIGLINPDKSIQIDLINPSNWKLTNNLTEICTNIYNCLINSI